MVALSIGSGMSLIRLIRGMSVSGSSPGRKRSEVRSCQERERAVPEWKWKGRKEMTDRSGEATYATDCAVCLAPSNVLFYSLCRHHQRQERPTYQQAALPCLQSRTFPVQHRDRTTYDASFAPAGGYLDLISSDQVIMGRHHTARSIASTPTSSPFLPVWAVSLSRSFVSTSLP